MNQQSNVYTILDEDIELSAVFLGKLLDEMADLDTFEFEAAAVAHDVGSGGAARTGYLTVDVDGQTYKVEPAHVAKAFDKFLGELRTYPAAILVYPWQRQIAACIADRDPNAIREDELLERLFALSLEAAGWQGDR